MADTEKLKQALNEYTGDTDSLNRFTEVATAELGPDWTQEVYTVLNDLTQDEQGRLDHAYHYYAALTAWEEIQGYLAQPDLTDSPEIRERIPVLSHWLTFFGEAGDGAVNQLQEKLGISPDMIQPSEIEIPADTMSTTETVAADTSGDITTDIMPETPVTEQTPDIPVDTPIPTSEEHQAEPIWAVEKVFRQIELTQSVHAWITARCIELGNIEVFYYPHYGFLVDLMQQTRNDIAELLGDEALLSSIEAAYPNGVKRLQNMQISLDQDLEIARQNTDSAETPLTKSSLSGNDIRQALGKLDMSDDQEYLGPAPDGFEIVTDPFEELDEEAIKKEYSRIENVVLSEQRQQQTSTATGNQGRVEKSTSQTPQNGVKRKLSFSLGNKTNKPSE